MKKGLKILLIIIVIIVIILIGLGIFMSIKGNKKPISTEQFINITTELFSSCMLICKHALYFWRRKKQ